MYGTRFFETKGFQKIDENIFWDLIYLYSKTTTNGEKILPASRRKQ